MDAFRVADAIDAVFAFARRSNKYIDETSPWILAKNDTGRLKTVLFNLVESIRYLGVLLRPFLPGTSDKILKQIGAGEQAWESLRAFGVSPVTSVGKPEVLFARLDEQAKLEELLAAAQPAKKDLKPEITIEDFAKLDLRVAKVVAAEKVEKADKLLKLTLDLAGNERQIVSGIAKNYTPETIVGKNVILIANLKPAKIRGVESNGMLLAASNGDQLFVCTTDGEIESGSSVS